MPAGSKAMRQAPWRWRALPRPIYTRGEAKCRTARIQPSIRNDSPMLNSNVCLTSLAAERALRSRLRASLVDWAGHVLHSQQQKPAAHHLLLLQSLQGIADRRIDRLMVLMPPGSAKSTYCSVLFPAWWLAQRPCGAVIATAHTGELARHFGRQVRALITEQSQRLGYGMARHDASATRFRTNLGGSYFATGVRGPVTGRRADLLLIDDPIRSMADADSAGARDHLWEWYRADLVTRLRPGGAVVLVMTRWHRDDLAGRLLAAGDRWEVLRLPALAEADDPLGRTIGTPLWPEWEDEAELKRKRLIVGERAWASLFQQRPSESFGGMFRPARWLVMDEAPDCVAAVRAWDLAATPPGSGDPDWTVGLKLGRTQAGGFVVLDVVRLQGGPAAVEDAIRGAALADGPTVRISLPQDPGQAGRAQVLYLVRRLTGYVVTASPESGAKHVRAMPVASQAEAGNLALLRAQWNRALIEELAEFPGGAKDDQVDALSRAFSMLIDPPTAIRRTNIPILNR
jgi:predicted phage terminase large subunit-like protein